MSKDGSLLLLPEKLNARSAELRHASRMLRRASDALRVVSISLRHSLTLTCASSDGAGKSLPLSDFVGTPGVPGATE